MKRDTALTCLVFILAFAYSPGDAQATAPAPSFTISASNITMPSSGNGSIPITLTSVNGYTGTVLFGCMTATPSPGVLEPYCNPPHFGPALFSVLAASERTVTASIPITSLQEPAASSRLNRPGPEGTAGWALAAALMLGFGIRRRRSLQPGILLLALSALIGLMGVSACGGGGSPGTLTPGTYTYTVQAVDESIPQSSASTTVSVIVPPGIPIQKP